MLISIYVYLLHLTRLKFTWTVGGVPNMYNKASTTSSVFKNCISELYFKLFCEASVNVTPGLKL